jgi:hypothetical protein
MRMACNVFTVRKRAALASADARATWAYPECGCELQTWALLDEQDNAHLISWSPSGDSFIVHQPDRFARELLPTVFKHNNYTSFVRQLNIYVCLSLGGMMTVSSASCNNDTSALSSVR